jgi:hypothetical protein
VWLYASNLSELVGQTHLARAPAARPLGPRADRRRPAAPIGRRGPPRALNGTVATCRWRDRRAPSQRAASPHGLVTRSIGVGRRRGGAGVPGGLPRPRVADRRGRPVLGVPGAPAPPRPPQRCCVAGPGPPPAAAPRDRPRAPQGDAAALAILDTRFGYDPAAAAAALGAWGDRGRALYLGIEAIDCAAYMPAYALALSGAALKCAAWGAPRRGAGRGWARRAAGRARPRAHRRAAGERAPALTRLAARPTRTGRLPGSRRTSSGRGAWAPGGCGAQRLCPLSWQP